LSIVIGPKTPTQGIYDFDTHPHFSSILISSVLVLIHYHHWTINQFFS